jgi:arsenate reductase
MAEWIIYYNPKCGSCRNALEILKEAKIKPKVVEYLKNPPSIKELNGLLKKLRVAPSEIIRSKELIYEELKLGQGEKSREDLLRAISEHPVLLQRPIVVCDYRAVIARPPEKVKELLRP